MTYIILIGAVLVPLLTGHPFWACIGIGALALYRFAQAVEDMVR